MKKIFLILALCIILPCATILTGCFGGHKCKLDVLHVTSEGHYYTCSADDECVETTGMLDHEYGEDDICDVCNYKKGQVVTIAGVGYTTLEAAITAAEAGSTITLTEDIDLAKTVQITKKLTIDLNGHKLFNTTDIWDTTIKDWSLISVRGGDLTIKNGTLEAKANDCYAIDVKSGSLTIESGNYLGNISAVYILEGNVTINGGTFDVVQLSEFSDKRYLVNCLDDSYTAGSAVATINGGSFVGFNPVNNLAEGPNTNFMADGHAVVENNGVYTVVAL